MINPKKVFFFVLLLFLPLPLIANAVESKLAEPVKVVMFPFRRAVISAIVDTTVKKYYFKEGESFSKGDKIVALDESLYRQKFIKAKAYADFVKKAYENNLKLAKQGGIGRYELAKSELEFRAAEAEMKIAQINLNACTIKAPFAGRLVKKIASEHEFVKTGQPVIEIIDDKQLLAVLHLPSSQKKTIQEGQEVDIKIDETGSLHTGKVHELSAEVDPRSRMFEVKILIDNSDGKLSAGMSGEIIAHPVGR